MVRLGRFGLLFLVVILVGLAGASASPSSLRVDTASADTLVGFRWNGAQEEILSIDPTTGSTSVITTLDLSVTHGSFAVDSVNHKAYMDGKRDGEEFRRLYTANLRTGEVSSIPYPDISGFDVYVIAQKLFVVIPGINDHGEEMLDRAEIMVRYDSECQRNISEVDNLSDEQVRQMVSDAAAKANEKGKDVIVNIDMDLENFTLWQYFLPVSRWQRSIRWAGRIANIASAAFREENPTGVRTLYAHSAGVDAASCSIRLAQPDMMYEDLILLNGRTNAYSLRRFLANCGYEWWQVKVFTSKGDYPASPWSLSNYDGAKREAGQAWVHLHSLTITGHSGVRDSIGEEGTFEVNLGSLGSWEEVATVEELILRDWSLY